MPDAVDLLKSDHETVKALMKQWENAAEAQPAHRRALAERIIQELIVHERIEEDVFYPAFKEAAGKEGRKLVAESVEEHGVVDSLIDQLQELDLDDEKFDAKFKVLKENLEHHIKEEEEEMFPKAKRVLGQELNVLGETMMELKTSLLRELPTAREIDGRRT